MPAPRPPEFRQRAMELARERAKPIRQIAIDLGISESCLRRWMDQADVDEGKKEGLSSDERKELIKLRRENRSFGDGERDPQARRRVLREGERAPKMMFAFIAERCSDLPVTACCGAMRVSTSGFYEWRARQADPCQRAREHTALTATIVESHRQSRAPMAARECMLSCVSAWVST